MKSEKLQRDRNNMFIIPTTKYNNLDSITGLKSNTLYSITFNDLALDFMSNNKGEIFFNNKKESLPVSCLIDNVIRLNTKDGLPQTITPIGNSSGEEIPGKKCSKIVMNVDLTKVKTLINAETRAVVIENGTLSVQENYTQDKCANCNNTICENYTSKDGMHYCSPECSTMWQGVANRQFRVTGGYGIGVGN